MAYSLQIFEGFEGEALSFDIQGDFVKTTEYANGGQFSWTNRDIRDSEASYFTMKATVPLETGVIVEASEVTFDYKVSSESGFDKLKVYRNGNLILSKSGEIPWTRYKSPKLAGGDHIFLFLFEKDTSASIGLDSVFIDNISQTYVSVPSSL